MARIENGKYVANKSILVSQATIDNMKRMGMSKAIERANSGQASEEEVEGARRFYGNRVTGSAKKPGGGPKMSNKMESAVSGEAVAVPSKPKFGKNESAI